MKILYPILIILIFPFNISGQFIPVTNQYLWNPLTINPAFAGNSGALNVAALYHNQWVGVNGAPHLITLCADAPIINKKIGLGFSMSNEKIGVTKETNLKSDYSFNIALGEGKLSMGLGAGLTITNTAWSDLVVLDPGDELYLVNSKIYLVPNFSVGFLYSLKDFYASYSMPQFLSYKFDVKRNKYRLLNDPKKYNYMLLTGYNYKINSNIKIQPSILLFLAPEGALEYDLNTQVLIQDKLWSGISYRNGRSVTALLQYKVNNQLRFGYAYGFDLGQLSKYSYGSHELMIRYEFRYHVQAVNPISF